MRLHWRHSLLTVSFALGAATNIFGDNTVGANPVGNPAFTTIDYPGAASTQAWGISPRGDIVGFYVSADKLSHGFLRSGDHFTAIDFPGAAVTLANGINPRGDIVGEYGLTSTAPHRGFLLSNGVFTSLDFPNATFTSATGINGRGEIVGYYTLADNVNHSFVKRGDLFTSLDAPGATSTVANGLNAQGDIAAGDTVAGVNHGLLARTGGFTTVDFPGAAFTTITGINPSGDMVGRYRDTAAVNHGFLLSGGKFSTIDFPGASFTGATAIDPAGNILGRYTLAGVNHGFLLSKPPLAGSYTVTDLGPVGGTPGQPFFISHSSMVSGSASGSDRSEHAVLWYKGLKGDIGTPGLGGKNSVAFGNNDRGQAVGEAETSVTDPNGEDFCGFRTLGFPGSGAACLPFVWESGVMTALPTLGGYNGAANSINDAGEIAGLAENATPDATCPFPQKRQFRPVIWENGKVYELPTVGGDQHGAAFGINQNGQAVGGSGECSPFQATTLVNLQPLHALLWDTGTVTDLGNLGGSGHGSGNLALNINNLGQVVGISDLPGDAVSHAFLWTKATGMKDLGTLPGDVISGSFGINDNGEAVGASLDAEFNLRAFHWQNGTMTDLNSLVSGNSSLSLMLACSVNARGEIIGLAMNTATGEFHAYMATPSAASSNAVPHAVQSAPLSEDIRKLLQRGGLSRFGVRLMGPR